MRLGGEDDGGGAPADPLDEVSDGEALYEVLIATLQSVDADLQGKIAMAFMQRTPWDQLAEDVREAFEGAGYVLFDDGEDGDEDEKGAKDA